VLQCCGRLHIFLEMFNFLNVIIGLGEMLTDMVQSGRLAASRSLNSPTHHDDIIVLAVNIFFGDH